MSRISISVSMRGIWLDEPERDERLAIILLRVAKNDKVVENNERHRCNQIDKNIEKEIALRKEEPILNRWLKAYELNVYLTHQKMVKWYHNMADSCHQLMTYFTVGGLQGTKHSSGSCLVVNPDRKYLSAPQSTGSTAEAPFLVTRVVCAHRLPLFSLAQQIFGSHSQTCSFIK